MSNVDGSRRDFMKQVGIFSLIMVGVEQLAFSLSNKGEAADWALALRKFSDQLLSNQITAEQWQGRLDKLFADISIGNLLTDLDFEAVRSGMSTERPGGHWHQVYIPGLSSQLNKKKLLTKIVGLERGQAVPPHGHENEVSTFLTLNGQFRLRQWDRRAMRRNSLDLTPAFDGLSEVGHWSSQSEKKTNVHWLQTLSREGYFLSVRIAKIDGTATGRERIFIDPDNAKHVGQGTYRVPLIGKSQWWEKYSRF